MKPQTKHSHTKTWLSVSAALIFTTTTSSLPLKLLPGFNSLTSQPFGRPAARNFIGAPSLLVLPSPAATVVHLHTLQSHASPPFGKPGHRFPPRCHVIDQPCILHPLPPKNRLLSILGEPNQPIPTSYP